MAYTTINKGSSYFNTVLYTGTGATNNITGVGFKPDFTWIKNRGNTDWHRLLDAVRGATNELYSNATNAETAQAQSLQSFNTDGFTLGTLAEVNGNANTFASWNWLASNTTTSNTAGSIAATISANTTSGFSVGKTTGTLSSGTITVGHGLGVAPSMILWKRTDGTSNWQVYHKSNGTDLLQLNTNGASSSGSFWPATSSTTFSVSNSLYGSGETYVFYAFAQIKGYSNFGSYTGNGSADGTFVYTGFKPAFIIVKLTSAASEPWVLNDNKRNPYNLSNNILLPNSADAEQSNNGCDILSNGFKFRSTGGATNGSGSSYIYMAFAENPFVSSTQIPTTAR
jgi:hypothetical protein